MWRSVYFASMLLVNIFLSRFLQASATGSLYYVTSILALVQMVAGVSLESGLTYFASGKLINSNKLLWASLVWAFVTGIIVLCGAFIYLHTIKHSPPYDIIRYCFFAVCYVLGITLNNYGSVLFYAQGNYFLPSLVLALLNIAFIVTLPFRAAGPDDGNLVNLITYRYFLLFFLQGAILVIAFMAKNKSLGHFSFPGLKDIIKLTRYSLVALLANLIFFLVYRIDYWFVHNNPASCTDSDLGNYIQVSKLGQLFLIVPQIIASVIFPQSAGAADRTEINKVVMIISRLFSQMFLMIIIITIVFGRQLFTGIFGDSFNAMQLPFIIIMPGIFCVSVLSLLSAYFSGKGAVKINLIGAAIALVVVVTGDYFLVPLYGIVGAAIVSTAGYFVNLLYSLLRFYKDYSLSWGDFFRWQKDDYRWLVSVITGKQ